VQVFLFVMTSAAVRPVVIGLTGSIGMGKSTAVSWLRKAGVRVHDADATVHRLYSPGGAAVKPLSVLIPGVEAVGGGIDRAKLSSKLRAGEANLKDVEKIVHPLVAADRDFFLDEAARDGEWLVVLDVPLLLETTDEAARARLLNSLLVVSAPAHVQRARVLARPGMTEETFQFILSKQIPDEIKRAAADCVIDTGPTASGFESFAPARATLAATLMSLAKRHKVAYEAWRDRPAPSPAGSPPSSPARVRGVSFDLDDTLFPTMPAINAASLRLLAALQTEMPKAYAAGAGDTTAMHGYSKAVAESEPSLAHDFMELRRAALLSIATAHGDPPAGVDAVLDAFAKARSDVGAFFYADAKPAIAALRAAGMRVGACTNGSCDVSMFQEVAQHFDFSVTAADAGCSKPAPVPFWFAAHGASCRLCELVHIGDDAVCDLQGALDAGCRAILVTRPSATHATGTASKPPSGSDEPCRPVPDPARWREVSSLDEAVAVVLQWQRES
jgi:dephospho-CoA kinase